MVMTTPRRCDPRTPLLKPLAICHGYLAGQVPVWGNVASCLLDCNRYARKGRIPPNGQGTIVSALSVMHRPPRRRSQRTGRRTGTGDPRTGPRPVGRLKCAFVASGHYPRHGFNRRNAQFRAHPKPRHVKSGQHYRARWRSGCPTNPPVRVRSWLCTNVQFLSL